MSVDFQLGMAVGLAIMGLLDRTIFVSLARRLNDQRRTVRIRGR